MKHYRWIVWDWNGTLLDDVDTAIPVSYTHLLRLALSDAP